MNNQNNTPNKPQVMNFPFQSGMPVGQNQQQFMMNQLPSQQPSSTTPSQPFLNQQPMVSGMQPTNNMMQPTNNMMMMPMYQMQPQQPNMVVNQNFQVPPGEKNFKQTQLHRKGGTPEESRLFLGVPRDGYNSGAYCDCCACYIGFGREDHFGGRMFYHCHDKKCDDCWDICLPCYWFGNFERHQHPLRLYSGVAVSAIPKGYDDGRKVYCKDCKLECSTIGFFHAYGKDRDDFCEDCFKNYVKGGNVKLPNYTRFKYLKSEFIKAEYKFNKKEENEVTVKVGDVCSFLELSREKEWTKVYVSRSRRCGWVPSVCFDKDCKNMKIFNMYKEEETNEIGVKEDESVVFEKDSEGKSWKMVVSVEEGRRGWVPNWCFEKYPVVTVKKDYFRKVDDEAEVKKDDKCLFIKFNEKKTWRYVLVKRTQKKGWVPVGNF